MTELLHYEEQIETMRAEGLAEKAPALDPDGFKISRTTNTTCIEFLAENDVEISAWISEAAENERVKKILRVWFTLFKPYNEQPWS